MARTPRAQAIRALWIEPLSDWTVALVRAALLEHERGSMRTSARLADAMGRDAEVAGALSVRVRALSSRSALPFRVDASDEGDGRKIEAVRRRQEQLWWHSLPEEVTAAVLRDAIMLGVAVGWISWTEEAGEWIPRLQWLPPHGLTWERGRGGEPDGWWYQPEAGERERVTPGDGRWFLYLPGGARSWLGGAVRTCAIPWLARAFTLRDWMRYGEKHGLPILSVSEPHWAHDDVEGVAGADGTHASQFYSQFSTLPNEAVLRMPMGADKDAGAWDAKWLEPTADTWETFRGLIDRCRGDIHMAILSRDAQSAPRGGDGEVSVERVRVETLSTDAETLTSAYRDQVWVPWATYNYDEGRAAGWGRWDTRPPPDMRARADTLAALSGAVVALASQGVDVRPVLAEFGLQQQEATT